KAATEGSCADAPGREAAKGKARAAAGQHRAGRGHRIGGEPEKLGGAPCEAVGCGAGQTARIPAH
ncbi:TPA: hypothetical protein ACQ7XV_004589, partial [Escherichia coli]